MNLIFFAQIDSKIVISKLLWFVYLTIFFTIQKLPSKVGPRFSWFQFQIMFIIFLRFI